MDKEEIVMRLLRGRKEKQKRQTREKRKTEEEGGE